MLLCTSMSSGKCLYVHSNLVLSASAWGEAFSQERDFVFTWSSSWLVYAYVQIEQRVEDLNILLREQGSTDRLYLVLPLTFHLNPSAGRLRG